MLEWIQFIVGAALILGGFWGIRQYQQSGFDQEVGYRYIQKLSGEVESLYTQSIQPVMAKLTDAEREALTLEAAALLKENWTAAVKADQSARADEMLAGLEGDKLQQKTMELLSITYSLNGPKVASAEKKQLAKWTDAERSQNREALLRAVLDESAPLPQAVASAVGELTEQEADVTRRGRNAQAKHAAPKHADPADYAHATGLEALWGYLYVTNQTQRLDELITLAIARTEEIWHRQNSK